MTTIRSRVSRCVALSVLAVSVCLGSQAAAQDAATLEKVTNLNKKAVAAYENLEFDEAIRLLQSALQLCAAEGMNKHAAKARTHIHLGMVMVGGLKQKDRGIAQFKRALEIDPTIKLTKSLVNPEIQAAFDEAVRTIAEPDKAVAEEKPVDTKAPPADPNRAPRKVTGVMHTPVTEAAPGTTITVKAAVDEKLTPDKVILAYRPEGASDYLARDMEKDETGWYVARIPEPATQGSVVSYYIEARNKTGNPLAANGSASEPHVVSLAAAQATAQVTDGEDPRSDADAEEEEEDDDEGGGGGKYFLAMAIGSGYGYASGTAEVSPTDSDMNSMDFSGFAPAQLMHIAPEVGYFYSPTLMLSLQGRIQLVTGATEVRDKSCPANVDPMTMEGVCEPAKGALAVLGKATWLLGSPGAFRPFASVAAGFGEIRHLVSLPLYDCGPGGDQTCQDTILGGKVLVGPAAGFTYSLSSTLAFMGSVNALAGFPNTTVNFDLNLGVALKL